MTRRIMIAGNWKMNLIDNIKPVIENNQSRQCEILVCPPFTHIQRFSQILEGSGILLGAQNMCSEDKGAFTGEISHSFLAEFNVSYVIAGHSERRHVFNETNELINLKH